MATEPVEDICPNMSRCRDHVRRIAPFDHLLYDETIHRFKANAAGHVDSLLRQARMATPNVNCWSDLARVSPCKVCRPTRGPMPVLHSNMSAPGNEFVLCGGGGFDVRSDSQLATAHRALQEQWGAHQLCYRRTHGSHNWVMLLKNVTHLHEGAAK